MPTRAKQAPNGDLLVSDGYGQNRIHRFSEKGELILSWGEGDPVFIQKFRAKRGPSRLGLAQVRSTCRDVMVTPDSRVYVLDRENKRWQVFTMDGEYISSEPGGLTSPVTWPWITGSIFHIVGGGGVGNPHAPDGELICRWGEGSDAPRPVRERPARLLDRRRGQPVHRRGGRQQPPPEVPPRVSEQTSTQQTSSKQML